MLNHVLEKIITNQVNRYHNTFWPTSILRKGTKAKIKTTRSAFAEQIKTLSSSFAEQERSEIGTEMSPMPGKLSMV